MKGKVKRADKSALQKVLEKKALGYSAREVVEEYSTSSEGQVTLVKKKVTKKCVPPDLTALKMLLDANDTPLSQLTDEQLMAEKIRLLKELKEIEKGEKG